MIRFDRVSFAYNAKTPILQEVSLAIPQHGVVGLTGPSGCGKTTLLRLLVGLEKPQSGSIVRPENIRISTVFQEHRLLPWLTVEENVRLVCPQEPETVLECLEAVSLSEAKHLYPDELSGGMQRRVALARALAYNGDVLVLDEPFSGLDDSLRNRIATYIQKQFGHKTIVLISHSPEEFELFGIAPVTLTAPLTGKLL